jgi:hypothetical protein
MTPQIPERKVKERKQPGKLSVHGEEGNIRRKTSVSLAKKSTANHVQETRDRAPVTLAL